MTRRRGTDAGSSPETMPGVMRVWMLGGFRLSVADRFVEGDEWGLKKARSLVKILALAHNHRLHKERVMDALWTNLPTESAANNLHRTLHAARKALGGGDVLVLRGEELFLSLEGEVRVDVAAFEAAASEARCARDLASYRTAVDLYAGDLLPEDLYEEWAEARREALRDTLLELLMETAALYEERGEYEAAVGALRKIGGIEPGRVEADLSRLRELSVWRETVAPKNGATLHNLPAPLTSFVGRGREMVGVKRDLSMNRLLTLTGPGGSGKTRLALESARDLAGLYPDGVWMVELAPLSDGSLAANAVAAALGVREKPDLAPEAALVENLRPKNALLILDNCEHVAGDAALLAESLLRSCPNLRVLATSRVALGVAGEALRPVPPLDIPDPSRSAEEVEGSESARLFVERASRHGSEFEISASNAPTVAGICRRLDGIPLAIELAASRVGVLDVEQISARLDDSLRLLTRGSPTAAPRQRTLRGALDWSHDLLEENEKLLFARLSAFSGGCSLEAAEAVGGGDGLERDGILDLLTDLIENSLVFVEPGSSPPRYRMLETIQQYARSKLDAGCDDDTMRRHAAFFLALAEEAEPKLQGAEHEAWGDLLDAEHDNLRAALRWAFDRGEAETGLRLAGSLGDFWITRGYLAECRGWLEAALKCGGSPAHIGKILYWAGHLAREQGDYERSEELGEKSLALARDSKDEAATANILHDLGLLALYQNAHDKSSAHLEEALEIQRRIRDDANASLTIQALGSVAVARRDYARAAELNEEALAMARGIGDPLAMGFAIGIGVLVAVGQGDNERAKSLRAEGLALAARVGHERYIVLHLHASAMISVSEGNLARAAKLRGAADALHEAIGSTISPLEEEYFGAYFSAIREGLEDPETPWNEGRAMSRDEATEYALSEEGATETPRPTATLSPREREVAALVADGLTNRHISEKLYISKRTVDNHVANILDKLHLESREEVATRFP